MDVELLPCPFCGGRAKVMHMDYGDGYLPEVQTVWGVFCERASTSLPLVMKLGRVSVLFKSADEAQQRTGIPSKSIQKCCSGILKTTHGVTFEYTKVVDE